MKTFNHLKSIFLFSLLLLFASGPSNVFPEENEVRAYSSSRSSPLDLVSRLVDEESSNPVPMSQNKNSAKNLNETAHISTVQITLERSFPLMPDYEEAEDPFAEEHPEYPMISDPLQEYNRFMYSINDSLFEYFLEPVARNYEKFMHEEVRLAIRNLFNNASSAVKLVSSLLQGDLDKSVRVLGRLVLNTTIGLGGLFDVAGNYYGVEDVNEDFSQMLGHYGIGTGPYLVLPFLGPSSGRNVLGRVVDSVLSPTILFSPSFIVGAGITLGDTVNSMSFNYQGYNALKQDAVDPYISLRDFQHQYREKLVHE